MKIALIGYGKMGQMIESVALERGHEIVCIIDKTGESSIPRENAREVHNNQEPTAKCDCRILSPKEGFACAAFRGADVAIEFSRPEAAEQNIRASIAQGVPVVSGTTGWDVDGLRSTISNHPGVMWSSNYSIGVNVLFAVNKYLARLLQQTSGYTPSITEIHHVHKLDAPSGTAKTLQGAISGQSHPAAQVCGAPGQSAINCPIESIREGEVPGIHEVRWESEADILTLRHEAKSRRGFALGAVIAAEWLQGKQGWHSMTEVMGLEGLKV